MLMRYFDVAREVIARFGGEIDKFIGDAVLAFWGTSVAREDDAERAVRAALDLVDGVQRLGEELGIPDLRARAGVLTGETSVGSGGNTTGLVIGDIVNTASRLQSIAEPGTVFVGDATRRLTEASIHFEDAGTHELKGKAEPVRAFRAVRVTAQRGGRGRQDGIEPPFVGRATDLRMLQDQLHETTRTGRARLVSIIAEAGHGKSRLAQELKHYVDGLAETYLWHEGRSPAYGDGVSFWAIGEMVRQRAGIAETDPPLVARTALRELAHEFATDDEETTWLTGYLSGLLGIDEMPAGDRSELFAALRTFFQRMAARAPVALIFEDLHWADDGLIEFLDDLVSRSDRHPIIVVTLARPELLERHPEWGHSSAGSSVRLTPLGEGDMHDLVTGAVDRLDPSAASLIVSASAGVPLYAVEFLRTLVAEGSVARVGDRFQQTSPITDLSLPDSLHAIIAARLDRFPTHIQRVVQDASVLGQSFTEDWLIRTSGNDRAGEALSALVTSEVLRFDDDPRSPERGQYQFVQPTIREVAYGRLPKAERAERHLAIAEQFSQLEDPEFAAVVADHYLRALEAGAGDEALEAAHRSLAAAAQRAADLHAHAQVLSLARRAQDLPGEPNQSILLLGAEAAADLADGEGAMALAHAAVERAVDEQQRLHGARTLTRVLLATGQYGTAPAVLETHWDPSRLDEPAMAWMGAEFARALMLANEHPRGAGIAEQVLSAAERSGDMALVIDAINTLGTTRGSASLYQGVALTAEAMSLAARFGSLSAQTRALNNGVVTGWWNGRISSEEDTIRFADRAALLGSQVFFGRSVYFTALIERDRGRFQEALEMLACVPDSFQSRDEAELERLLLMWALDGNDTHLAELIAAADARQSEIADDFQGLFLMKEFMAKSHFLAGDLEQAVEIALGIDFFGLPPEYVIEVPLLATLELRDTELLDRARNHLPVRAGTRMRSFHTVGEAIGRLLADDPAGPEAVLDAARLRAECDGPLAGHVLTATLGTVSDHPAVQDAATDTERWFRETGGVGYLHRFAQAWRQLDREADAG
jgi:hypothetical protein